jgi:phosphoglycerate dehydrogenase-like enzyme
MQARAAGGSERVRIIIPGSMAAHRDRLEEAIDGRADLLAEDQVVAVSALVQPTVVVTGMDTGRMRELLAAPGLAWVHSTSSGVDHLPLADLAQRGILLTNSAGAHAPAMAEHALGAMIAMAHGFPAWAEAQRAREWLRSTGPPARLLRGRRLGIVGYGAVGRQLAMVAGALGMLAWGIRRTPGFTAGEPLESMLPPEELHRLLEACDFVVLCASLNATSRRVLGADELARMKPGAFLVNVARGGLVDETALAVALSEGRIAGAALDATAVEPLPADSPLWTAPGLMLTPHVSGSSTDTWDAVVDFLVQNLRVYLSGAPSRLGNQVRYESVL